MRDFPLPVGFARLRSREVGVHRNGADTLRAQLVVLVLHQGDEGTDDDSEPGENDARQLVYQGFSAPGRHYDQSVFASENGLQRLPLAGTKFGMPKALTQQLTG